MEVLTMKTCCKIPPFPQSYLLSFPFPNNYPFPKANRTNIPYFSIQNKATGAVLDLGQSNPADGAPVFVLDDAYPNFEAQKTQAWHLVPV